METILFDCTPETYKHWKLSIDDRVATLTMDVAEDGGLLDGYKLKLNSYDLGVDMELYDALQRIRFEHPRVGCVVLTSGKERIFSAGANVPMMYDAPFAWKVNFARFSNEVRVGMEDSSHHCGLKFIAGLNGTAAGGGYELALACDEIYLVDDQSSVVSFPEVPLLGVLPGTGGLTRLIEKRHVRPDLADVFSTSADGVKGKRAKQWKLVDDIVPAKQFADRLAARARELADSSTRPRRADGIRLTPLQRCVDAQGYHYRWVDVAFADEGRSATITVTAPDESQPTGADEALALGADWWPLAMARELDDALLLLRTNQSARGTLLLKTRGSASTVIASDSLLDREKDHWFIREVTAQLRRTLARLDVTPRSLFALIEEGSCFAGSLFELALTADRSYMIDLPPEEGTPPSIALTPMNFGPLAGLNGWTRLESRFNKEPTVLERLRGHNQQKIGPNEAAEFGLVTFTPDDLDWHDEIRVAVEERSSLSPDALTGMEANLRFAGRESLATKVHSCLSAWQNWIFDRPNASGEEGALRAFSTGKKAKYKWDRA